MTRPNAADAGCAKEAKLPRRDWILLPTLSLLTICLLAGSVELYGRQKFARLPSVGENCLLLDDPSNGARGIPNCVIWEKIPEGKLTEYRFNSSGYRNNADFGPKSPGTYRIVMVGTSVAAGFRVPQAQTVSALLPTELSRRTGRKVEVYNEALPWRTPGSISRNFSEALASNPDMILWLLSPLDIAYPSLLTHRDEAESGTPQDGAWYSIKTAFDTQPFSASIATIFGHTRAATLLKEFLYESPSQYVQSSLMGGDYKKEFLQSESSAEWSKELREFDSSASSIAEQARKAGIRLVVVFVPDRTQAALISMTGECPKGFDPYKVGKEVSSIIVSHGGTYLDILPEFRTISNPQMGYFALDGHPNAFGHAMIARFLTNKLADVAIPPLSAATKPLAGLQPSQ
jgi:hypothetical protein